MQVCSLHRLGRRLLIDRRLLLTSVAARIFPFLPPSLPATAKLAPITRPLCLWATINHHRRTAGGPSSPAYRPGDVWRCWLGGTRSYCSLTDDDVRKEVEEITALFFEARELLDDAVRWSTWSPLTFQTSIIAIHVSQLSLSLKTSVDD